MTSFLFSILGDDLSLCIDRLLSTAINAWYGTVTVFAMSSILKEKMGMV